MVTQMKILLVGPPSAGKTSLLHRLTIDDFIPEYYPTTSSDFSMQEFILDEEDKTTITTQIWDIGGNTSIGKTFTKSLSAVVLVIDATTIANNNMTVLDQAYDKMMAIPTDISYDSIIPTSSVFPFLIVLNKVDLMPEQENYDLSPVVTWLLSKAPANPENINIMSCSAKTGYNVMALFETIIKSVLAYQMMLKATSSLASPSSSVYDQLTSNKPTSRRNSLRTRGSITGSMVDTSDIGAVAGSDVILSNNAPTMNIQAKLVLVGAAACGKTSLLAKFLDASKALSLEYEPTLGTDLRIKEMRAKDRNLVLQLWDTAGDQRQYNIGRTIYKNADGAIFMYDITSRNSFNELDFHWSNFMKYATPDYIDDYPLILVGNKYDDHHHRAVMMDEALAWCMMMRPSAPIIYMESSSLQGVGVEEVFGAMADMVVENMMLIEEFNNEQHDDELHHDDDVREYDELHDDDEHRMIDDDAGSGSLYNDDFNDELDHRSHGNNNQGRRESSNSLASSSNDAGDYPMLDAAYVARTKTNMDSQQTCWTPFTVFCYK